MTWLVIALGGALGAMARHAANMLIHRQSLGSTFPLGIFIVNVAGSFTIGLIGGLASGDRLHLSPTTRTFLIVGLLGGFTTFSSFSFDTLALVRERHYQQALWNVAGQVGLSLAGVWAGFRLGLGR